MPTAEPRGSTVSLLVVPPDLFFAFFSAAWNGLQLVLPPLYFPSPAGSRGPEEASKGEAVYITTRGGIEN